MIRYLAFYGKRTICSRIYIRMLLMIQSQLASQMDAPKPEDYSGQEQPLKFPFLPFILSQLRRLPY